MEDSTTPIGAEQERERAPSLQGDAPLVDPYIEAMLERVQAMRRRQLTITTVEQEDDDTYTLTFRYLTNDEAKRTILASRHVRPLSPASARALWTLERMPHVLKRHRRRQNKNKVDSDQYIAALKQAYLNSKAAGVRKPSHAACARNTGVLVKGKPITRRASVLRLSRAEPPTKWDTLTALWEREREQMR